MLGFMLFLFVMAMFHALVMPKIPNRVRENIESLLALFCVIFVVMELYHKRIVFTCAAVGVYMYTYLMFDMMKEKGRRIEAFVLGIGCIALCLFFNRGIKNRVIDSEHVINSWDQYNMNFQLRNAHNTKLFEEKKKYDIYVATLDDEADTESRNEILDKIKGKNHYQNYLIVCLNYNNGKLVSTGYSYDIPNEDLESFKFVYDCVRNWAIEGKVHNNLNRAIYNPSEEQLADASSRSSRDGVSSSNGQEQWDDEEDSDFPGAHWVNGYDREDGTHVDGYYRTNPDGDPTNNFNYSGPDANNNSDAYDYYNNYDDYNYGNDYDSGYDGGADY